MYSEAVSVHLLLESYSSPFFDTELIACLPGVYRVLNNAGELLFSKYVPDRYIPYCRKKGFFKEARNCLRMKDHYQLKISIV